MKKFLQFLAVTLLWLIVPGLCGMLFQALLAGPASFFASLVAFPAAIVGWLWSIRRIAGRQLSGQQIQGIKKGIYLIAAVSLVIGLIAAAMHGLSAFVFSIAGGYVLSCLMIGHELQSSRVDAES